MIDEKRMEAYNRVREIGLELDELKTDLEADDVRCLMDVCKELFVKAIITSATSTMEFEVINVGWAMCEKGFIGEELVRGSTEDALEFQRLLKELVQEAVENGVKQAFYYSRRWGEPLQ
jgi:hypothetical protein